MQDNFNLQNKEITVSQLLQDWLSDLQSTIRPTSFVVYQGEAQNHLMPFLGEKLISDLTVSVGEELREYLINKGLSERTVNDVAGKLGQALRWGVDRGYQVPILKQTAIKQESQEMRFLTKEEQIKLESSLYKASSDFFNMIILALHAGLTIGELCALSWEDIDLERRTLKVHQICQRASNGLIYSEIEPRRIPMPRSLRAENGQSQTGFFVKHTRGEGCEPRLCQFWLKKHLKENRLPEDITFVTLRNTYIRRLLESGTDFIQVSYLSGCKDLNLLWRKFGEFYLVGEAS